MFRDISILVVVTAFLAIQAALAFILAQHFLYVPMMVCSFVMAVSSAYCALLGGTEIRLLWKARKSQ